MQLHDSVLKLAGLVRSKVEVTDVVWGVLVLVVVSELSLHGVGTQQSVSDERAGKTTRQDVITQLEAQIVPRRDGEETEMKQSRNGEQLDVCVVVIYLKGFIRLTSDRLVSDSRIFI